MTANHREELDAVAAADVAAPHEVLALRLGAEEYGIDILRVQEIRSFEPPTRIAGAPAHVLGVTNLRGTIVPLVDLRARFGLAPGAGAVTVVLNVAGRTVGAVVDAVSDVVALSAAVVQPPPAFARQVDVSHITGIATLGDGDAARLLILLDIERLLASPELGLADASVL